MSKQAKVFLISFSILCIIFFGVNFYFYWISEERNEQYHFSGIIDAVTYDVKGIPTINLNEKEYYLSAGYNFDHQIERGDSLKKDSGSTTYTLIKNKTREIIMFNN